VVLKTVLDTNAILYFLGGRLAQPLPVAQYFISVISEMELLSYPSLDEPAQARVEEFLSRVIVIGLNEEVKTLAIRLRKQYSLKLPDAIVAATALGLSASLLTNDSRLLQLPGLRSQALALKEG